MALTLDELGGLRDELVRARAEGVLEVTHAGKTVRYRSDGELHRAIRDLELRIAAAGGQVPVSQVRFATSKGL